jgi:hypothetical protein
MRLILVLAALIVAASAGANELVIHQRSATGPAGSAPRDETVYLAGSKVVSDSAAMRTIVDLDAKTITAVDKTKRTYSVSTFDDVQKQMETLRQELDRLPPEAKKMMGGLFDDGPPLTVTPTGKTSSIAGHKASEYTLSGGPYSGSVWATDEIPSPPEFQRWRTLQANGGMRGPSKQLGDALQKINGFPLRTDIQAKSPNGTFVVSNEVVDVKEGTPPADALTVPAGYKRLDTTSMPPGQ